jgi:lipopolysaccharide biosynthesis regulator YciM
LSAIPPAALLFAFIAIGAAAWFLGRRAARRSFISLPRDYFVGLDHLINDRFDRATEVFARMSEDGGDAAEIHFALGSLFRRRGETERAIRIHERLRTHPAAPIREQAGFALALDYFAAGLMDRAERLFQELATKGEYRNSALEHLMRIYEQQRDWANALRVFRELPGALQGERRRIAAHYLCELAELALVQGDVARVRLLLEQSRVHEPQFARERLLAARLAQESAASAQAITHYLEALDLAPALLLEIVPRAVGLAGAEDPSNVIDAIVARLRHAHLLSTRQMAWGLASTLTADQAMRLPLGDDLARLSGEAFGALASLVNAASETGGRYQCADCGFRSVSWYWHCPSCRAWDTLQPAVFLWADRARFGQLTPE